MPKTPPKGQRAKVDIFTIDIPRFLQDKEIVLFMHLLTLGCVVSCHDLPCSITVKMGFLAFTVR